MKDIFISYKTEEFEEANWVKSVLENNGISCWMAPESIPGGSNYAIEIPKAIRECKAFVLILSARSQASQWVSREVDRAINEGKVILPFMLENCALKDDFNFYLTNVQRYAAYESKTKAIEKMLKEIKAILGIDFNKNIILSAEIAQPSTEDVAKVETVKAEPAPTPVVKKEKAQNQKKKSKWLLPVVAIALVVAVIVGIATFSGGDDVFDFGGGKTITIAGEDFKEDDSYISLDDKELTAKDLEKLSEFSDLNSIYLTNCTFPSTDISAVFAYVDYTVRLDGCGITQEHLDSIDFETADIVNLNLDNNPEIYDLSGVSSFYSLQELSFINCGVSDISFAAYLYDIYKFVADNNGISDIYPLAGCTKLENLSLNDNQIASLQPLGEMKELKDIQVANNELTDLTGLENALFLECIDASGNSIANLDGLRNCTQLETVILNGNKISDISVLSKSHEKLYTVNLSDNMISDISSLADSVNLFGLYIDNNRLTNLDALSSCTALDRLSASNNQISDISGIADHPMLIVQLANNNITSIDGITFDITESFGLKFDISNNQITELTLKIKGSGNHNFNEIRLYGNDISDFSALKGLTATTLAFDYNENIDFAALKEIDSYGYYVIDCPLDKQVNVSEQIGVYSVEFVTEQEFLDSQNVH